MTAETVEGLNSLLADLQIFYQNVRGFHWNIRGSEFFELHAKFEELYTDLQLKIDEVAERILTLGGRPLHTYEAYLAATDVHAVKDISNGPEALKHCVAAFSVLLLRERALLQLTGEAGDEGHQCADERLHPRAGKDRLDVPRVFGLKKFAAVCRLQSLQYICAPFGPFVRG